MALTQKTIRTLLLRQGAATPPYSEAKKILRIPVTADGHCFEIMLWIRLRMDEKFVFENHPSVKSPASRWRYIAYNFPQPVSLSQSQIARIYAPHNRNCPWFFLDGLEEPPHPA